MAIHATKEMCFYCFEVLDNSLNKKSDPEVPPWISNDKW